MSNGENAKNPVVPYGTAKYDGYVKRTMAGWCASLLSNGIMAMAFPHRNTAKEAKNDAMNMAERFGWTIKWHEVSETKGYVVR